MPTHKGQIAFPGGKAQAEDKDIVDTAVRETKEFPVYPVVCKLESVNLLDFNNTEVQKVYSVDITYLNDLSNWVYRGWYDSDWIVKIEEDILWGATAGMTLELFQLRLD